MTKLHQIEYIKVESSDQDGEELLAVSTEDGRILFYSTKLSNKSTRSNEVSSIALIEPIAQLGGRSQGQPGRIKNFAVLRPGHSKEWRTSFLVVTSGSDGGLRVWTLDQGELPKSGKFSKKDSTENSKGVASTANEATRVGKLVASYETGNRITCMKAFIMREPDTDFDEISESEPNGDDNQDSDSDSESES